MYICDCIRLYVDTLILPKAGVMFWVSRETVVGGGVLLVGDGGVVFSTRLLTGLERCEQTSMASASGVNVGGDVRVTGSARTGEGLGASSETCCLGGIVK